MPIRVALNHKTTYNYDRLVTLQPQVIRLRPAPHCRTAILAYSLHSPPRAAFPQLAAGSLQQLPGAGGVSTTHARVSCGSRPCRRDVDHQPLWLFRRGVGGALPLQATSRRWRGNWCPIWKPPLPGRVCKPWLNRCAARPAAQHRLPGRDQPPVAFRGSLCDPHGARRARPGGDSDAAQRLVPRFVLAARAGAAPPRPGCTFRFRLPAAAFCGHRAAGRPGRAGKGLHRSARLGGSLSARRRLDWARPDFRPDGQRGAHTAGLRRRPHQRRAYHGFVCLDEGPGERGRSMPGGTAASPCRSFACRRRRA